MRVKRTHEIFIFRFFRYSWTNEKGKTTLKGKVRATKLCWRSLFTFYISRLYNIERMNGRTEEQYRILGIHSWKTEFELIFRLRLYINYIDAYIGMKRKFKYILVHIGMANVPTTRTQCCNANKSEIEMKIEFKYLCSLYIWRK